MIKSKTIPPAYISEELLTGTSAVAHAVRLADVDVISAYPIRPYTEVMDVISKFIADGELDADYIIADSEHSQFEIVKHASAVGARVFAGSSGTGWMHAMEALVVTASDRLPVVALVGNRALDDPGAFGVEHNDALMVRDVGWLLVWASNAQEALDTTLLAYRIAEDARVMMPCAVALDGAFLTHSQHMVKIPSPDSVKKFLPPYILGKRSLHPDNPITIAAQVNEDWVMEIRRQQYEAVKNAKEVIYRAYKEFNQIFDTNYEQPFFDKYMADDAEMVLVGMGAVAQPAMSAVKQLRNKGKRVGFIKIRWFRPFPTEELGLLLSKYDGIGVIDRDFAIGSPNTGGVLYNEILATLYGSRRQPVSLNFLGGLGGREISIEECITMYDDISKAIKEGTHTKVLWMGVRE